MLKGNTSVHRKKRDNLLKEDKNVAVGLRGGDEGCTDAESPKYRDENMCCELEEPPDMFSLRVPLHSCLSS
jgi:hypothetical protein